MNQHQEQQLHHLQMHQQQQQQQQQPQPQLHQHQMQQQHQRTMPQQQQQQAQEQKPQHQLLQAAQAWHLGGQQQVSGPNANANNSHHHHHLHDQMPTNGKKTKGRVRIEMKFIHNKLRRYTTFSKRKTGIMKKAFELATLTGTQVMLLVASETGHVYTYATDKLKPMIISDAGKALIQTCLNSPDSDNLLMSASSSASSTVSSSSSAAALGAASSSAGQQQQQFITTIGGPISASPSPSSSSSSGTHSGSVLMAPAATTTLAAQQQQQQRQQQQPQTQTQSNAAAPTGGPTEVAGDGGASLSAPAMQQASILTTNQSSSSVQLSSSSTKAAPPSTASTPSSSSTASSSSSSSVASTSSSTSTTSSDLSYTIGEDLNDRVQCNSNSNNGCLPPIVNAIAAKSSENEHNSPTSAVIANFHDLELTLQNQINNATSNCHQMANGSSGTSSQQQIRRQTNNQQQQISGKNCSAFRNNHLKMPASNYNPSFNANNKTSLSEQPQDGTHQVLNTILNPSSSIASPNSASVTASDAATNLAIQSQQVPQFNYNPLYTGVQQNFSHNRFNKDQRGENDKRIDENGCHLINGSSHLDQMMSGSNQQHLPQSQQPHQPQQQPQQNCIMINSFQPQQFSLNTSKNHMSSSVQNSGPANNNVSHQLDLVEECNGMFIEYQTTRNPLGSNGLEELHSLNVGETIDEHMNMLSNDDCFATGDDLQDFGMIEGNSTNDHFLNMLFLNNSSSQGLTTLNSHGVSDTGNLIQSHPGGAHDSMTNLSTQNMNHAITLNSNFEIQQLGFEQTSLNGNNISQVNINKIIDADGVQKRRQAEVMQLQQGQQQNLVSTQLAQTETNTTNIKKGSSGQKSNSTSETSSISKPVKKTATSAAIRKSQSGATSMQESNPTTTTTVISNQSKFTTTNTNKRLLPKKSVITLGNGQQNCSSMTTYRPSRPDKNLKKLPTNSWMPSPSSSLSNASNGSAMSPPSSSSQFEYEAPYKQQLENLKRKLKIDVVSAAPVAATTNQSNISGTITYERYM